MATSKLVLAILGIVFLLLNPAGVCAGMSSAQPQSHASHPCCPPPAGSHSQQSGGACVCIDRQPAVPVLPSLADTGLYAPAVVTASTVDLSDVRIERLTPTERIPIAPDDRVITLHQILV